MLIKIQHLLIECSPPLLLYTLWKNYKKKEYKINSAGCF